MLKGMVQDSINKLVALASSVLSGNASITDAVNTRAPASTALSTATWDAAHAAACAGAAQETNPILAAPIASGLSANYLQSVGGGGITVAAMQSGCGSIADTSATTHSSSWVDALNYTGSGVIEFAAFWNYLTGAAGATSYQVEIIIDGISAFSKTFSASTGVVCPVGSITMSGGVPVRAYGKDRAFKSSIQIRHKVASGTADGACVFKITKT